MAHDNVLFNDYSACLIDFIAPCCLGEIENTASKGFIFSRHIHHHPLHEEEKYQVLFFHTMDEQMLLGLSKPRFLIQLIRIQGPE